ncbi:MAG: SMP-30/gluconolactonase/LRE family protein [Chloroflexota bacterium]|nr:SMP-30/gluconolactonase/LRE family protein [Chloroflexota bacterium]
MQPALIADYEAVTGECPAWNPVDGHLYWVDIPRGRLFRWDPISGHHAQMWESGGAPLGGLTVQSDGALLLFLSGGAIKRYAGGVVSDVIAALPLESNSRFNDAIADPAGRVFTGTVVEGQVAGRLLRIDPDKRVTVIREGVGISNGMGFSPDLTRFYHTDSTTRIIDVYDYDARTGDVSNRRVFITLSDAGDLAGAVPDGMTVDADGCIWSAVWDGRCIIRYAPDGTELTRIMFPARKVSSAALGGADGADLYVTTAGGDQKATEGDGAGALFCVSARELANALPGWRGRAPFLSRIGDMTI